MRLISESVKIIIDPREGISLESFVLKEDRSVFERTACIFLSNERADTTNDWVYSEVIELFVFSIVCKCKILF